MMEYINIPNIFTAGIALLMFRYLVKIINSDIGDSKAWNMASLIILGTGLYLWRSGSAIEIVEFLRNTMVIG